MQKSICSGSFTRCFLFDNTHTHTHKIDERGDVTSQLFPIHSYIHMPTNAHIHTTYYTYMVLWGPLPITFDISIQYVWPIYAMACFSYIPHAVHVFAHTHIKALMCLMHKRAHRVVTVVQKLCESRLKLICCCLKDCVGCSLMPCICMYIHMCARTQTHGYAACAHRCAYTHACI